MAKPWLKVLIPVVAILAAVLLALTLIKSQIGGDGDAEKPAVEVGSVLEDLEITRLDGEKVPLSKIPGKVFLMNFWATWCEACLIEMPSIVALKKSMASKGLEVLFVSVDQNPKAVVPKSLADFGIDFPTYIDADQKLAELFDVHGIPLTVVLDRNRKVLLIEEGERDWNDAEIRSKMEGWLSAP